VRFVELGLCILGEEWQGSAGVRTGPMALSSVNSNTFSIADFEGSRGGGLTSVGWSAIAKEDVEEGSF
jgi:hypothetical protein